MRKIIFGVLLLISIIGCTTDVELEDNIQSSSMDTKWSLKKISGGIAGINLDYVQDEVYWTFNSTTNILTVENNLITAGPKSTYGGPPTGTYNYTLASSDSVLFIEGMNRGEVTITTTGLTIDDGIAVDGLLTEFIPVSAFQ